MIIFSWGIKISAVCSFVSSQSTRVTDRRTDRQNYDPQDRRGVTTASADRAMQGRPQTQGAPAGTTRNIKKYASSVEAGIGTEGQIMCNA